APQCGIAPRPTAFSRARRLALRDPIGRSRDYLQKQSSPRIHKMQHTVLSVAGLKGTMSEFELNLMKQRSLEARRQKARRGELQFPLPVGFRWTASGQLEKDPDLRVQQALELVSHKMTELGSIRQVLIWFRQQNLGLPVLPIGKDQVVWKPPVYRCLWTILTHPLYAGAYAYGRREVRIQIVEGRARKGLRRRKPRSQWTVLIRDHHPGYISWEQYERNQRMIA